MLSFADAGLIAGTGITTNAFNTLFNGLVGSLFGGGSSADEQMKYLWKQVAPMAQLGGKSYQQIANELSAQLNQRLTEQQSAATWSLAQKYATQLPTLQRLGMLQAGINPILAYSSLGGSSPSVGSSVSSQPSAPGLSAYKSPAPNLTGSAISVKEMYGLLSGMLSSEKEAIDADVEIKHNQADLIKAQQGQVEANTARSVADMEKPGLVGEGLRSALSTGRDLRDGIADFFTNIIETFDEAHLRHKMQDNKPSVSVDLNGKPHSKHTYNDKSDSPVYSWPF